MSEQSKWARDLYASLHAHFYAHRGEPGPKIIDEAVVERDERLAEFLAKENLDLFEGELPCALENFRDDLIEFRKWEGEPSP